MWLILVTATNPWKKLHVIECILLNHYIFWIAECLKFNSRLGCRAVYVGNGKCRSGRLFACSTQPSALMTAASIASITIIWELTFVNTIFNLKAGVNGILNHKTYSGDKYLDQPRLTIPDTRWSPFSEDICQLSTKFFAKGREFLNAPLICQKPAV